jgi:hypothetical protein
MGQTKQICEHPGYTDIEFQTRQTTHLTVPGSQSGEKATINPCNFYLLMPDAYTTALKFGWVGNSPYTTHSGAGSNRLGPKDNGIYAVSSKMRSSKISITAVFIIIIIRADSENDHWLLSSARK